jgi:hypothetical protein
MLQKIFSLFLLLCSFTTIAQKIDINEDNQVLVGGKLFGTIETIGEGDAAVLSFLNTDEEELITTELSEDKKNLYKLTFSSEEGEGYMTAMPNMRMALVKEILRHKLVENNQLNAANVKKYCAKTNLRAPKISSNEKDELEQEKMDAKAQAKEDALLAKEERNEERAASKEEKASARKDKKEASNDKAADERTPKKSDDELLDELIAAAAEKTKKNDAAKPVKNVTADKEIKNTDDEDPFADANKPIEEKPRTAFKDSSKMQMSDVQIVLEKDQVIANGKYVGKYKAYNVTVEGKPGRTISFYTRDAKRIGVCKYKIGEHAAVLTTATDGQQQTIGFGVTDENDILLDILTQVVELGYLK